MLQMLHLDMSGIFTMTISENEYLMFAEKRHTPLETGGAVLMEFTDIRNAPLRIWQKNN